MRDRRDEVSAALRYTGDGAPRVVAAGRGALAGTILARAHEAGVPVHRDPELVSTPAELALGDEVPPELWTAVAEVLAWVHRLDRGPITPKG